MADNISLDWCSFTVSTDFEDHITEVLKRLEFSLGDTLVHQKRGFQGYSSSATIFGFGKVAWDFGRLEMGVHCSLPASALSNMCAGVGSGFSPANGLDLLRELVSWCTNLREFDRDLHFTRCDFALDDKESGLLSFSVMLDHIQSQALVKRSKKIRQDVSLLGRGHTLYFGDRVSDTFIRIYDKSAEQDLTEDIHWIRVELVIKNERADDLIDKALKAESPSLVIAQYVLGQLEFKNREGDDLIKTRWPIAPWWLEFLNTSEKLKLSLPKSEKSVKRVVGWVQRQVTPSLALIARAYDNGPEMLSLLLNDGFARLSEEHKIMIKEFQAKVQGRSMIDFAQDLGGKLACECGECEYCETRERLLDFADMMARKHYDDKHPTLKRPSQDEIESYRAARKDAGVEARPVLSLDASSASIFNAVKALSLLWS